MTHIRRHLFVALTLLGASLSVGCHLGITNRPALFPNVAYSPSYARAGGYGGGGYGCGPAGCYREFGPNAGCGGWLFSGPNSRFGGGGYGPAPAVSGPVFDAPVTTLPTYGGFDLPVYGGGYSAPTYGGGFPTPTPSPGCAGCGANSGGMSGIPIAGTVGGPPIAVSPVGGMTGGPIQGVPYDSGAIPTLKPPPGSVPLQMPSEVKESKKVALAGK